MFEHKSEQLIPGRRFAGRILRSFGLTACIIGASLLLGVCGYHYFNGLPWIDALLDASMILGGMGPVNPITTTAGKLFASFYALYSGLVLIVTMGILLAPVIHRILHRFHADVKENKE